jgi:hypothetical protein
MMKTKNVQRAESAGVEKEEKRSASATIIISSRRMSPTVGQMLRTSGVQPPPT